MKRTRLMTLLAATLAMVACRIDSPAANTQSLDNFARSSEAALHENQCKGEYNLIDDLFSSEVEIINIHEKDDAKRLLLQTRVESALRAVPTEIQVAYFGLGGIIEVTPLAHEICSQGLDEAQKARISEGDARIKGCWKHQTDIIENEAGDRAEDERVVMYIDADARSIEHALVRTFGYVLSQVLVKIDQDGDKPMIRQVEGDPHFALAKEQVTMAFLSDVARSKGKYTLARYTELIGEEVISADDLARRSGWDLLKQRKPEAARAFMDYVFAETFDSYYCSAETRAVMDKDFAGTAEMFLPISEAITALSMDLETVDSIDELANLNDQAEGSAGEVTADQPAETTAADQTVSTDSTSSDGPVVVNADNEMLPAMGLTSAAGYGLWGGRIFRGIGRVVGGIGRGVLRVGRAVVVGAGRVVRGAARVAVAAVRGVLRFGAAVVRGVGKVAAGIFRGAVRIGRAIVRGAGRLVLGAARLTLGVGRMIVRGAGRVLVGIFGPAECYATEAGMVLEKGIIDADSDGVEDARDLCSNTPAGARVHTVNQDWLGCAGGQYRDRDIAARESSGSYGRTRRGRR